VAVAAVELVAVAAVELVAVAAELVAVAGDTLNTVDPLVVDQLMDFLTLVELKMAG